ARTIIHTLAWNVDSAAAQVWRLKAVQFTARSRLQVSVSIHESSHHVECLRTPSAHDRRPLTTLGKNQFARLDSHSLAARKGGATSSQRIARSTNTPATVVNIVIGIPKRA